MNVKENYMAAMRGQQPEWIGHFGTDVVPFTPSILNDPYGPLYGMYYEKLAKGEDVRDVKFVDGFGVTWVLDEFGPITEPGNILMEDISEWREKFHIPDPDSYDWDNALKEEYQMLEPGKAVQAIIIGPFMQLVNSMGFENALMALVADEDEVKAFLDALVSYQEVCLKRTLERVPIDFVQIFDDIANANSLFMSPDVYRKLIKPYHKRLLDAAKSVAPDMPFEIHCCGKCEAVIDDFVDTGFTAWQPAQPMNDLDAVKAKYGNRFVLIGTWDNVAISKAENVSEEEIRQSVRACMNRFAPGGGFIFWDGGPVGMSETMTTRLGWANDEAAKYGHTFYQK